MWIFLKRPFYKNVNSNYLSVEIWIILNYSYIKSIKAKRFIIQTDKEDEYKK